MEKLIAEEILGCRICATQSRHIYKIFCKKFLFFCYDNIYTRTCQNCGTSKNFTKSEFEKRVFRAVDSGTRKLKEFQRLEAIKNQVKKCKICGGDIYPDMGFCPECAVRKPKNDKQS